MARIGNDYSVTLGNQIPNNTWVSVTENTTLDVATTKAVFIVRLNDDAFWGFFYTPNSTAPTQIIVPANSLYCIFTKPSSFTGASLAIALESSVFSDPVMLINGADDMYQNSGPTYLNYYRFDIRPYFTGV